MKWNALFILAFVVPASLGRSQDATPSNPPAVQAPISPPAAPPAVKPPVSATSLAADNSYVIGPTDMLTLTVLKEPTLSSNLLVRPDGMITVPLLGDIKASGLTPLQLAGDVATRLKKYIQDPNVSVILTQINSKKVYLIGEIGKVGPIDLTPGMTLLEAVASAGGVTQYANARKMYILRIEDGKHTKIPVQYKQALKGNSALNLPLMAGDTIVIP